MANIPVVIGHPQIGSTKVEDSWEATEQQFRVGLPFYSKHLDSLIEIAKLSNFSNEVKFFVKSYQLSNFCVVFGPTNNPDMVWRRTGRDAGTRHLVYTKHKKAFAAASLPIFAKCSWMLKHETVCLNLEKPLAINHVYESGTWHSSVRDRWSSGLYSLRCEFEPSMWLFKIQIGRDVILVPFDEVTGQILERVVKP